MVQKVAHTFHAATQSPEEASAFSALALSAGGEVFQTFFGKRAGDLLMRLYPYDDNYMSYRFAHFARIEGEIAGLLCAFSYEQKKAVTWSNHTRFLKEGLTFLPRMAWYAARWSGLVDALEHLEQDELYIEFLAVFPKFQRKGLALALLEHAADIARQQGERAVVLDVDVENTPAIRAYEAWGMEIVQSSKMYRQGLRNIGVHRMKRVL
ncbi:MAG: GNAT family N-acetyltransferase [Myxococcales bacterium]|nr:GNAT family N-acetyltransferase [Myxococcales bacterium]